MLQYKLVLCMTNILVEIPGSVLFLLQNNDAPYLVIYCLQKSINWATHLEECQSTKETTVDPQTNC